MMVISFIVYASTVRDILAHFGEPRAPPVPRPPAARRYGTHPMPGRVTSTPTPNPAPEYEFDQRIALVRPPLAAHDAWKVHACGRRHST